MSIEKKTLRSDIPGTHAYMNGVSQAAASEEARRLVIGRDISLRGEIAACDHLVIEGMVQADVFTARRVDVLESGLFRGTAEVQDCTIAGNFEGKMTVRGRLTVKATGRILGEVEYGMVEIEAGGKIEGKMTHSAHAMLEAQVPAIESQTAANVESLFSSEAQGESGDDEDGSQSGAMRSSIYRRVAGR